MPGLDAIISQPVRLRVMASLVTLAPKDEVDFTHLRDLLGVTDGNLGAHLQRLEDAGYIKVTKTFVARKPKTFLSATARGRSAFDGHVEALQAILRGTKGR